MTEFQTDRATRSTRLSRSHAPTLRGIPAALALGLIACQAPMEGSEEGAGSEAPSIEELRQTLPEDRDVAEVMAALAEQGCAVDIEDSILVSDDRSEHLPFVAGPTACESDVASYMVVLVAPDHSIRFAGGVVVSAHVGAMDGVIARDGELVWAEEQEWQRQATSAAFGPYAARTIREDPTALSSDRFDRPVVTPYGACGNCVATCKDDWSKKEAQCDGDYDLVETLTLAPLTCWMHETFGGDGTTEGCFDSCGDCPSDDRCETDDDCYGWFSGCPSDDPADGCPVCETHSYPGGGSVGVCSDSEGDPS